MKRLVMIAALCVPAAALATAFDGTDAASPETFEIRVPKDKLAECQATLRELRQRPAATDSGWWFLPATVDHSLPRTVCVAEA